jgi:hypothetical protein
VVTFYLNGCYSKDTENVALLYSKRLWILSFYADPHVYSLNWNRYLIISNLPKMMCFNA